MRKLTWIAVAAVVTAGLATGFGSSDDPVPDQGVEPSVVIDSPCGTFAEAPGGRLFVKLYGPDVFQARLLQEALGAVLGRTERRVVSQVEADRLLGISAAAAQPGAGSPPNHGEHLVEAARMAQASTILVGTMHVMDRASMPEEASTRVLAISLQLVATETMEVTGATYVEFDARTSFADVATWVRDHMDLTRSTGDLEW